MKKQVRTVSLILCAAVLILGLIPCGAAFAKSEEKGDGVSLDLRIGETEYYGICGGETLVVDSLDVIDDITVLMQDGMDVEGASSDWSMSNKFLDSENRGVLEVQVFASGEDYITFNLQSHYADCPGAEFPDFQVMLITIQLPRETPKFPFEDVSEKRWSYDDVYFAWSNGLMNGVAENAFAPTQTTSRAMIVTILYRLESEPMVNYSMSFKDVKSNQWYTEAIRWAAATGIVNGYSTEVFAPNDNITREQMAAILYRYAEYKHCDVSARADISIYDDCDKVSSWANDSIAWAKASGFVNGISAKELSPQGKATREQVAAILHRFCDSIVK